MQRTSVDIVVNVIEPPKQTMISNLGPPMFQEELPTLTVEVGKKLTYELPAIADPDDDKYAIAVTLGEAMMFTKYSNGQFNFEPAPLNVKATPYRIKVVLTDDNQIKAMSQ